MSTWSAEARRGLDSVSATDPELIGHQGDGSDRGQITAVIEAIGSIDWLVVTLSGSEGPGPLAELDLDMLRRAFDAKFWGHITTIQAALPNLAPDGSITLLGAITARTGMPGTAGIAAINGAVEALVKPLATELAPIRVNGVSPGFVDTPWWSGLPDEARDAFFARGRAGIADSPDCHRRRHCRLAGLPPPKTLPTRRIATAEDIADAVVFAATNLNMTGTVIESDGGARLVSMG